MSKSFTSTERITKLLQLSEPTLRELIASVKEGLETDRINVRNERTTVGIGILSDYPEKVKVTGVQPKEYPELASTTVGLALRLIDNAKKEEDISAKNLGIPQELDSKIKSVSQELITGGALAEIDYRYNSNCRRLDIRGFSGTAKLRLPGTPLIKKLYPSADLTLSTFDIGEVKAIHVEVSRGELKHLIERLGELDREIDEIARRGP